MERQRLTDPSIISHQAMFLMANLQVGGSWAGNPEANTAFLANYDIDSIRVWKKGLRVVAPNNAVGTITLPETGWLGTR